MTGFCQVMGIVNVTPDSFSDGGKYFTCEEAMKRVRKVVAQGADMVDLGGESTRPGATPISVEEELNRLNPVFAAIKKEGFWGSVPISVDTYHYETAAKALSDGANIINCVYRERVAEMLDLLKCYPRAELVVPYRLGDSTLLWQAYADRVYIDPMIGFGTTREEDVELIRSLPKLAKKGRVLVGVSRKRIVKKLTGEKVLGKNLGGNLALAIWCAMNGASVVRVHDVGETVQALTAIAALG